ncbi:MAG: hypothetical protein EXR98_03220 [Gemmataceae bacterium]|nr:hypothetical protein [Gemmataceae bacterium]
MNALADPLVAAYLNDNFVSTYLKVGAFQIINGQKVGGNVASYFCVPEGGVLHALAGKTDARTLLKEARWAVDIRKSAFALSTEPETGAVNLKKFARQISNAHTERYHAEGRMMSANLPLPASMPRAATQQAQTHWLLAKNPAARLQDVYPTVWRQILNEKLSDLPVERH